MKKWMAAVLIMAAVHSAQAERKLMPGGFYAEYPKHPRRTGAEDADKPLHDIPRLTNVVVDGKADDWGAGGFKVDVMLPETGGPRKLANYNPRLRLAWSDTGLLALAIVDDDCWVEYAAPPSEHAGDARRQRELWRRDSVELFLATEVGGSDVAQWSISPGMAEGFNEIRRDFHNHRHTPALAGLPSEIQIARTRATLTGSASPRLVLEVLIPWNTLAIEAKPGAVMGFQAYFNDADSDKALTPEYVGAWYPGYRSFRLTKNMHNIRLAECCDGQVLLRYDERYKSPLQLIAQPDYAGRIVTLDTGTATNFSAVLALGSDGYARGTIAWAPPAGGGSGYGRVDVLLDKEPAATVKLGARADSLAGKLANVPFVYDSYVFSTPTFPKGTDASVAAYTRAVGRGAFRVRYFNAGLQEVATADAPGRYIGVVEVSVSGFDPVRRYTTLYASPAGKPADGALDPGIRAAHSNEIAQALAACDEKAAILLAGLHELPAVTEPGAYFRTPAVMSRRMQMRLMEQLGDEWQTRHNWIVQLPRDYDKYPDRKWPTHIFHHGGGLVSGPFSRFIYEGVNDLFSGEFWRDFIIVLPHNRGPGDFDELLDLMEIKYRVDPERVSVSGHSLGSHAGWMPASRPGRLCAGIPICGGAPGSYPTNAPPVWVFLGETDTHPRPEPVRQQCERLIAAGCNVKCTVVAGAGHGVHVDVFRMKEVNDWLREQRRKQDPSAPPNETNKPEKSYQ